MVDKDNLKLQIPGVKADGHVYLYLPTLSWKVWENHPCSVLADPSTIIIFIVIVIYRTQGPGTNVPAVTTQEPTEQTQGLLQHPHQPGLTIYVRTHTGLTAHLRSQRTPLPVLVESTPILLRHPGWHKLFSASRSTALVDSVGESLSLVGMTGSVRRSSSSSAWRFPGSWRKRLQGSLGSGSGGVTVPVPVPVTVLVSGPRRMADEIRAEVARLSRDNPGTVLTFVEGLFSW
ncbi:hypothetical protein BJX99DRAFT_255279 [Aspergillus californicus]